MTDFVPQWLIEKKRDGGSLTAEEIRWWIEGYTSGSIPDYQMAALAMAIYLKGMDFEETTELTMAMMHSGDRVDTSAITIHKSDKHSTGGIGDKVSLILAPLAAACGLAVPMISGRGLGITGGTLDKMESVPGYRTQLNEAEFIDVIQRCGCSIIGQTEQLAPADRKLYALRDVTATVPSIPLITASIMCKKLAEGIDSLVLDVKWGQGAFMKTREDARQLAQNMVAVGTRAGKGMAALITNMNQPLGHSAGNAVEVLECIDCLKGNIQGSEDLMEITLALTARMLILAGRHPDEASALKELKEKLASGAALDHFRQMLTLQGGDPSIIEQPEKLPGAPLQIAYPSPADGWISAVDAEAIGRAVLLLGGGRQKTDDVVDPAVGLSQIVSIGKQVSQNDPLLQIHARDEAQVDAIRSWLDRAFTLSDAPPTPAPLIDEIILSGDPRS